MLQKRSFLRQFFGGKFDRADTTFDFSRVDEVIIKEPQLWGARRSFWLVAIILVSFAWLRSGCI